MHLTAAIVCFFLQWRFNCAFTLTDPFISPLSRYKKQEPFHKHVVDQKRKDDADQLVQKPKKVICCKNFHPLGLRFIIAKHIIQHGLKKSIENSSFSAINESACFANSFTSCYDMLFMCALAARIKPNRETDFFTLRLQSTPNGNQPLECFFLKSNGTL